MQQESPTPQRVSDVSAAQPQLPQQLQQPERQAIQQLPMQSPYGDGLALKQMILPQFSYPMAELMPMQQMQQIPFPPFSMQLHNMDIPLSLHQQQFSVIPPALQIHHDQFPSPNYGIGNVNGTSMTASDAPVAHVRLAMMNNISVATLNEMEFQSPSSSSSMAESTSYQPKQIGINDGSFSSASMNSLDVSASSMTIVTKESDEDVHAYRDSCFGDYDTVTYPAKGESKKSTSIFRHGISRYAPYGCRFAAEMVDGSMKVSHVAGDLGERARLKGGKGAKKDLILVTHVGERKQLDEALHFYDTENENNKYGRPKPGPSEVLGHLKDINIDFDYRKGHGARLLQRNASNFFKRMMEHARRINHPVILAVYKGDDEEKKEIDLDVHVAATILYSMKMSNPSKKRKGGYRGEDLVIPSNLYADQSQFQSGIGLGLAKAADGGDEEEVDDEMPAAAAESSDQIMN